MSAGTLTPARPDSRAGHGGHGGLRAALRAEWIKFRTVRGWVIAMVIAPLLTVGLALLDHSECGGQAIPGGPVIAGLGCGFPVGPGGGAVTDSFYLVHQPVAGGDSITARVTSLTSPPGQGPATGGGLGPWSKAGLIIKASTRPGSAYAAMMVTAGHGVRMQYDFTGDIAGLPGAASATSPRWLRLTRAGDTVTGYDSADGTHWDKVGTATLAGLPRAVQAGLFAASPAGNPAQASPESLTGGSSSGGISLAAARFDHVSLRGQRAGGARPGGARAGGARAGGAWAGDAVGGPPSDQGFRQAGGSITVTGSGDIAPDVPAGAGRGTPAERALAGTFGGLIVVIVVATMFITAEYRRGLIRVTFSASPARGQVLAAKAIVIGSVTFAAGLAGATAALLAGEHLLRSNGNVILPVSALTDARLVTGTAALLAVAAVLALGLGTILRHGAGAVTAIIATMVLPYFFATPLSVLPPGAAEWLLRVTPAAAFSIQQSIPQYPQVSADYTPANGYFPLAPWAGLAVLCGYAALALALAAVLLRRRDA